MKRYASYAIVSVLFSLCSVASAVTNTGTGEPENTEPTFDLLAWMLSWLPF